MQGRIEQDSGFSDRTSMADKVSVETPQEGGDLQRLFSEERSRRLELENLLRKEKREVEKLKKKYEEAKVSAQMDTSFLREQLSSMKDNSSEKVQLWQEIRDMESKLRVEEQKLIEKQTECQTRRAECMELRAELVKEKRINMDAVVAKEGQIEALRAEVDRAKLSEDKFRKELIEAKHDHARAQMDAESFKGQVDLLRGVERQAADAIEKGEKVKEENRQLQSQLLELTADAEGQSSKVYLENARLKSEMGELARLFSETNKRMDEARQNWMRIENDLKKRVQDSEAQLALTRADLASKIKALEEKRIKSEAQGERKLNEQVEYLRGERNHFIELNRTLQEHAAQLERERDEKARALSFKESDVNRLSEELGTARKKVVILTMQSAGLKDHGDLKQRYSDMQKQMLSMQDEVMRAFDRARKEKERGDQLQRALTHAERGKK